MRYIIHVDMDAFFAAVEQRDRPELGGQPVIIGADPKGGKGRGVVATCSYEARKYGIHSAMPISLAYQKCPQGIYLPPDMAKYSRVSGQIMEILYEFTPQIEPVSIDEAWLDITESYHLFGTPRDTCVRLKARIKEVTGLTASVGLAPNKFLSKVASDLHKPDGLTVVEPEKVAQFLHPLDISKIWGLGEKSRPVLYQRGIKTIGDLARMEVSGLTKLFGKSGGYFHQLALGIDEREVVTESEAKSVSNEFTFDTDTADRKLVSATLLELSEKVGECLRQDKLKGRTITLKIRLTGFVTYTRSVTVPRATNFTDEIYQAISQLWEQFETRGKKVRLVGVKVANFTAPPQQASLFSEPIDRKREFSSGH